MVDLGLTPIAARKGHKKNPPYLGDTLKSLYLDILRAAPEAQIFVLGYPRIMPTNPADEVLIKTTPFGSSIDYTCDMTASDARWFTDVERRGNTLMRDLIREINDPRLHFVDTFDVFDGHELCRSGVSRLSADSYMNPIRPSLRGATGDKVHPESYHPDLLGHAAMAAALDRCVARLDLGAARCDE